MNDGIEFVKTKCGHDICYECYVELKKNNYH